MVTVTSPSPRAAAPPAAPPGGRTPGAPAPPVEQPLRGAGPVGQDLDLAPSDAPDPEAEHLADCLLGRPPTGDAFDLAAAVAGLAIGQHARAEAIRKTTEQRDNAVDVDQIHPDLVAAHSAGVKSDYSTVTDLARLRGWSTSVPRATATSYASSCHGSLATTAGIA